MMRRLALMLAFAAVGCASNEVNEQVVPEMPKSLVSEAEIWLYSVSSSSKNVKRDVKEVGRAVEYFNARLKGWRPPGKYYTPPIEVAAIKFDGADGSYRVLNIGCNFLSTASSPLGGSMRVFHTISEAELIELLGLIGDPLVSEEFAHRCKRPSNPAVQGTLRDPAAQRP